HEPAGARTTSAGCPSLRDGPRSRPPRCGKPATAAIPPARQAQGRRPAAPPCARAGGADAANSSAACLSPWWGPCGDDSSCHATGSRASLQGRQRGGRPGARGPCAHGDADGTCAQYRNKRVDDVFPERQKTGRTVARAGGGEGDEIAFHTRQGRFARGVHRQHEEKVTREERRTEISCEIARARVKM